MVLKLRVWTCAAALFATCSAAAVAAECLAPKPIRFEVQSEIKRDTLGFTQGLEVRDGLMFESTGAIAGTTRLTTINPAGRVTVLKDFGKTFFGEGLTILNDAIYQLSWTERTVFVHDLNGAPLRRMKNPRDGWGLTNDGTSLIFTDGGDRLYFAKPETFEIVRATPVRERGTSVPALNELEYVAGKIYANIFMTWDIVRVDPGSGCIEARANLRPLHDRMSLQEREHLASDENFVLNGIAYDRDKDLFYLTGKNWKTIFTGRFVGAD